MTQNVKSPLDEVNELFDRSTIAFEQAMFRLARAQVRGNSVDERAAQDEITNLFWRSMSLADLLGRKRLLMEADARRERQSILGLGSFVPELALASTTPVVPHIPFEEAIADLVSREPRLAKNAADVQKIYQERHAFSLARNSGQKMIQHIRDKIVDFERDGIDTSAASTILEGIGQRAGVRDFTRSYAELVYRMAVANSYAAGREAQAYDPDVSDIITAFQFQAVMDADTRPNHAAAHELTAAKDDPVWNTLSPPLSWMCRCVKVLMDRFEIEENYPHLLNRNGTMKRAQLPPGAFPDSGFGKRQDHKIYGS